MNTEAVKIDIVGGFLGAGKTTFINKLIADGLDTRRLALIENEFGDESIDDEVIESAGFSLRTLPSGCICCTLKSDFITSITELVSQVAPERIIIEPTGLAGPDELETTCKMKLIAELAGAPVCVNSMTTVVDAQDVAEMIDYDIPVYRAQLEQARFVVMSHVDDVDADELAQALEVVGDVVRPGTPVMSASWDELDALEVLGLSEQTYAAGAAGDASLDGDAVHGEAGREGHGHEGGHRHGHAGFSSRVLHTERSFGDDDVDALTSSLSRQGILRAKGFLPREGGGLLHYEFVNGRAQTSAAAYAGPAKLVVIGRAEDVDAFSL